MSAPVDDRQHRYLAARRRRVILRTDRAQAVREGPDYLYRPGQVLVALADEPAVRPRLERLGGVRATAPEPELDVIRYDLRDPAELHDVVREVRSAGGTADRPARVGPNHVVVGEPVYHGNPASPPEPVDASKMPVYHGNPEGAPVPVDPDQPMPDPGRGDGVTVTVLDTGLAKRAPDWHPQLAVNVEWGPDDVDLLDAEPKNGYLDLEAGHGTFIAGIVRWHSPDTTLRVRRVLDTDGVADELAVAHGLLGAPAGSIVNLSLGCYTHGDVPPVALEHALARLPNETVVVAAAGNNDNGWRPYWPAAFPGVLAVAALEAADPPKPAPFTNRGPWVDVAAPGVDLVSTYVHGRWLLEHDSVDPVEDFAGWAEWSGTSFATAYVSAKIAELARTKGGARAAATWLLANGPAGPSGCGVVVG